MIKVTALRLISEEHDRAIGKFDAFHNAHEGWGVLREEYLELEDEIRQKHQDLNKLRTEAIHVAAMALRFMIDLT